MNKTVRNRFGCTLNPSDYPGTCYNCQHYYDYGPVVGKFTDHNGKCTVDGHETDALVSCKNNNYLALEDEIEE